MGLLSTQSILKSFHYYPLVGPLGEFERNGLPPKNSGISGSLDSVMTATTTADNTFDNAPQVGSWVASFDKLLKDPAGVQCFQVCVCVCCVHMYVHYCIVCDVVCICLHAYIAFM